MVFLVRQTIINYEGIVNSDPKNYNKKRIERELHDYCKGLLLKARKISQYGIDWNYYDAGRITIKVLFQGKITHTYYELNFPHLSEKKDKPDDGIAAYDRAMKGI